MKTLQKSSGPKSSPQTRVAGPLSKALFDEEQLYFTPGLQSIALFSELAMEGGRGCVLEDADGRQYLDFVAGIGVASIGHAHPKYVQAISEQVSRISVGSFTTRHRLEFAKSLAKVTPKGLNRIQLYSSGAEAVEAALRLAKSHTKKFEAIGFWGGFHGKTGGVLGLLGGDFKMKLGPLMPGLFLTPYPNPYRCPFGTKEDHDCAAHCLQFLRDMIRNATTGAISAILCEPIQGTAGNVIPPPGFLTGVREIAHEHGALWIADEMITGFGRTGRWFGCQHEPAAVPDILTIGKGMAGGLPVSGIITTAEIAQSLPFANPSGSSSSYGGNPLAAAAADVTLQIIRDENLVENSRRVGKKLLARFQALQSKHAFIGDVRGRGLLIGVELVADPATKEPLDKQICRALFHDCLRRGLVTMSYSPAIRINPPLNITEAQADQGAGILEEALAAIAQRFHL